MTASLGVFGCAVGVGAVTLAVVLALVLIGGDRG